VYDFRKIKIGVAPTRRDMFPPAEHAIKNKETVMKRLREIFGKIGDLEVVDIDSVNSEGILVEHEDIVKTIELFRRRKVDAVFMPHLNFGQEEAVGRLGSALKVPFLLWGPRDPRPDPNAPNRELDTQCGLFASGKILRRSGVPFTYIENCWLDSPVLEKGINDFICTASAVKAFRNMRILQISTRPRQFLSVMVNESMLLERFGIEISIVEATEVTNCIDDVLENRTDELNTLLEEWDVNYDLSDVTPGKIENMAALEIGIKTLAEKYGCSVVACECWHLFGAKYGIRTCFVFGDLARKGMPVSCETDVHGCITAALMLGATRMDTPTFLADLTIRHPDNDNAELLWHCGPFPGSLATCSKPPVKGDGLGWWEIKGGDITLARFDADKDEYYLFAGEGRGIKGPATDGNYVWFETDNWVKWEKKFVYGPYIHHVSGVHGKYKEILHEACKYLCGVIPDSVD